MTKRHTSRYQFIRAGKSVHKFTTGWRARSKRKRARSFVPASGGAEMEIAGARRSGGQAQALVAPHTAARAAIRAAVPALGPGAAKAYAVYGSVEGPAEALDVRGEPYFTVRDAFGGGEVRCYFGDGEREEIALAVAARRIVSVGGILHHDQAGRLQRIDPVRSFAVIDEPLPGEWVSPAGLFAGIGDTQEYLRSIRGE